jgi:hypothetical protein
MTVSDDKEGSDGDESEYEEEGGMRGGGGWKGRGHPYGSHASCSSRPG